MRLSLVASLLLAVFMSRPAVAGDFPDGVTPNDAYASMELLNRGLDALLQAQEKKAPTMPTIHETSIHPMHVYQLAAEACNRVGDVVNGNGGSAGAAVVVQPQKYHPKDVKGLGDRMLLELNSVAPSLGASLPSDAGTFSDKKPKDVFPLVVGAWVKASVLAGNAKITPNEVYSQMVRGVEDSKQILGKIGISYDSNAPAPEPGRKPSDVLSKALEVRGALNNVREQYGEDVIAVPEIPTDYRVRPIDVYVQTQIILADLNLLKMVSGTSASSAEAVKASRKSPTDVWAQAAMIEHLVGQIKK